MTIKKDDLRQLKFFTGLSDSQLDEVCKIGSPVTFSKGSYILHHGAEADAFFVITSGTARIYTEVMDIPSGGYSDIVPLQNIGPGQALGWSWMFEPYKWKFDAKAAEDVQALRIEGKALNILMEQNPELGCKLLKKIAYAISQRLAEARNRLVLPSGKAYDTVEGG